MKNWLPFVLTPELAMLTTPLALCCNSNEYFLKILNKNTISRFNYS